MFNGVQNGSRLRVQDGSRLRVQGSQTPGVAGLSLVTGHPSQVTFSDLSDFCDSFILFPLNFNLFTCSTTFCLIYFCLYPLSLLLYHLGQGFNTDFFSGAYVDVGVAYFLRFSVITRVL